MFFREGVDGHKTLYIIIYACAYERQKSLIVDGNMAYLGNIYFPVRKIFFPSWEKAFIPKV